MTLWWQSDDEFINCIVLSRPMEHVMSVFQLLISLVNVKAGVN